MNLKDNPMKQYSQRDTKWANEKLGFGSTTIGSHGCKLTSFSMLDGRTPSELNTIFKEKGCFSSDLLDDKKCAQALGWTFMLKTTDSPSTTPCIAEVDMSPAPNKQQHFVVWQGDTILDPWTGTERPSTTYPVASFRNFVIKEPMKKELIESLEEALGYKKGSLGENLNEKEQEDVAKKIKQVFGKVEQLEDEMEGARKTAGEQNLLIIELQEKLRDAEAKLAQSQPTETPDSIDSYSLTELAGAFFRKLISVKK